MKTIKNKKFSTTMLALTALIALCVVFLVHGCGKPATYSAPSDTSSAVTSTVTIAAGLTLQSIALDRPNSAINDALPVGLTDYFTATGTYLDSTTNTTSTQDITSLVDWTSSDPLVAAVTSVIKVSGRGIMAHKIGTTTITASLTTNGTTVSQSMPLSVIASTGY